MGILTLAVAGTNCILIGIFITLNEILHELKKESN